MWTSTQLINIYKPYNRIYTSIQIPTYEVQNNRKIHNNNKKSPRKKQGGETSLQNISNTKLIK